MPLGITQPKQVASHPLLLLDGRESLADSSLNNLYWILPLIISMAIALTSGRTFAAGVAGLVLCFTLFSHSSAQNNAAASRLDPKDVTWRNVEVFEEQVRDDLPVGTSLAKVEDYLRHWQIKYAFARQDKSSPNNTIQAVLENLGWRGTLRTSLSIYIQISDQNIEAIRFRVEYL